MKNGSLDRLKILTKRAIFRNKRWSPLTEIFPTSFTEKITVHFSDSTSIITVVNFVRFSTIFVMKIFIMHGHLIEKNICACIINIKVPHEVKNQRA